MKLRKSSTSNLTRDYILNSLREFGIAGTAMILGGTILLVWFPFIKNFERARLFGAVGFGLIFISIFNSYLGLLIHKQREKLLITMVENTCNRLAEQLAKKDMTDYRSDGITQKIRQTQEQIIKAVCSVNFIDGNSKKRR